MTELTQLIDKYIENDNRIGMLQDDLNELIEANKNIAKLAVETSAELGETIFTDYKGTGQTVSIGYKTTYTISGGELKNPALRREFFNRVSELMHTEITNKIVFKEGFVVDESGNVFSCEDAALDGRYTQKLIKSLPHDFLEQCIKDGLISFRSSPRIEVE